MHTRTFTICQVLDIENIEISIETLALQTGYPDEIEAVYKIVRHLAANNRNIALEGDLSNLLSLKVSAI